MCTSRDRFIKLLFVGSLVALAVGGCEEEATVDSGAASSKAANGKGEGTAGAAAPKASVLSKLSDDERLRYSFTDLAHFADRSRKGHLVIDLGQISARKYTNGGWRSGWNTTPRKDGNVHYFEADSKSVRVFFKHSGKFDKIVVRMKAVKTANKVVFYLNDKAISNTKIDGEWKDYTVEVGDGLARAGENQLLMRFTHDTKVDGRRQVALIDSVHVLPSGAKIEDGPKGPRLQTHNFDGKARASLVAASPQTYTFRLHLLDQKGMKLGLAYGAKKAGAKMTVTAVSDTTKAATLLDETVSAAGKWQEKVLDLDAFAGQATEITFEAGGDWGEGQLAAWGEPALYSPELGDGATAPKAKGVPAKNLVIYLIDTLRYDKLHIYNEKSSTDTPNLDAFGRGATIFDAAYDNENWTKPSCATVLTGLYPETHRTKEDSSKLPQKVTTIGEHLQKNKFRTGGFIANGYVSDAFGFKQGWDRYTNYIREKKVTDAERLVKDTLEWIDKKPGERFFAYVQTIDPHVPYSAPKEWKYKYQKGKYEGKLKPQATGTQLGDIKTGKMKANERDKRYLEELYDGEVAYNDHEFGKFVAGLKERGVYDDTIILVITDHGEEFWDHGSVGHGHSLYEELLHSPMLLRYPNQVASGRRVPHVVSMVDVVPTMLDMLGVDPIKEAEGISFVDTFDGIGTPRPRIAVSDFLYRKKSIRAGNYTWITIGRGGDLYDVVDDPKQKKDIIKKHYIGRAFIRAQLGMFKGAKDVTHWWLGEDRAAAKIELEADKVEMNPELKEQLEAMGYVQGAKGPDSAEVDKKKLEEEDN